MSKLTRVRLELVGDIPEQLEPGIIYVSRQHKTAMHLCCCGCGREVVTPLSPAAWTARIEKQLVSLHPSIGNASLPCRSHYWIRRGRVEWVVPWTESENSRGWHRDREIEAKYFEEVGRGEHAPDEGIVIVRQRGLWEWLKSLLLRLK